jgi:hypothetical protein
MAVTVFAGTIIGTILGLAVQNRRIPILKYLFGLHPVYGKLIGTVLVAGLLLAPSLMMAGGFGITSQEFFWGGCFAYSFLITFGITVMTIHPLKHSTHRVRHLVHHTGHHTR